MAIKTGAVALCHVRVQALMCPVRSCGAFVRQVRKIMHLPQVLMCA